jgi:hypothetical protein
MVDGLTFSGKWKTTSILLVNGRRPDYFHNWKTTSNLLVKGKRSTVLLMADDLKYLLQMECYLNKI